MMYRHGAAVIYHDVNYNARSAEMLAAMEELCETVTFVSYAAPKTPQGYQCRVTKGGFLRYCHFLRGAFDEIRNHPPEVLLLHDCQTVPVLIYARKKKIPCKIVFDSSEFYLVKQPKQAGGVTIEREEKAPRARVKFSAASVKTALKQLPKKINHQIGRANVFLEGKYLRYADVVLVANEERAELMVEYKNLSRKPLVHDNIHRITDEIDVPACDEKYAHLFREGKCTVLYAGGIARQRRTFDLVKSVSNLSEKIDIQLLIIGREDRAERARIDAYLEGRKPCYHYLGYLPRSEIRYLLQHSDVSVSTFARTSVNNILCASGKVYESLFEGVPIAVSENPPLKRLCREERVGVSHDDFEVAITELYQKKIFYRNNVETFAFLLDKSYNNRIHILADKISSGIEESQKA